MSLLKIAAAAALVMILPSCATLPPTRYVPKAADGFGLEVVALDQSPTNILTAIFNGNKTTPRPTAYIYSVLGAFEHCEKNNQFAIVLKTKDFTKEVNYTKVTSSSYTTPGYSSYNGQTYRDSSLDTVHNNTYSTPVTDIYPIFATPFICVSHIRNLQGFPVFENLSREIVHPVKQDFKGGLLITSVDKREKTLQVNDVILSVEKTRIETGFDIQKYLENFSKPKVNTEIIRNKKIISLALNVIDNTDESRNIIRETAISLCTKLTNAELPLYCESLGVQKRPEGV